METTVKTNRLAILSLVSGLVASLLAFGLLYVRISRLYRSSDGTFEFWFPWVSGLGWLASLVAIITGILALSEIRKQGGIGRGRISAWVGIFLGAACILFLLGAVWILCLGVVALIFILALFFPFADKAHLKGAPSDEKQGGSSMKSLLINLAKILFRVLAVILVGFITALIGFFVAVMLAYIYELISGQPFVINGRQGYEAAGPIGFVLGALMGLIGSSSLLMLLRRRTGNDSETIS